MSSAESPLNAAHEHAENAHNYTTQGLLIPAAEEHYTAAQGFQACVEQSSDENTKRTLRMLYNDHLKAGKELQRRIAKLREEGKDPAQPQKSSPPRSAALSIPHSTASPPPHSQTRMSDSQATVDESFMLLGQRSDPGDAFNHFWKIMEGMLDNLSQPVAFAAAPLGPFTPGGPARRNGLGREGSSGSDTDLEVPRPSRNSRKYGLVATGFPPKSIMESAVVDLRQELEEVHADGLDELSESFCLIPSSKEPSLNALKQENATLKADVEEMQRRLAATEKMMKARIDQDQRLRDSIVLARKEAQRAMGASHVLQRTGALTSDLSVLNLNAPPVPPPMPGTLNLGRDGRDREPQLLRRVRELEEETRLLRAENEKQKALIVKFRDRWEKLKESAKRKKGAKAAAESEAAAIRDRIDEEPEAEQEQDEQMNKQSP